MSKFDEIKADYKVTAHVPDMDMIRILRENRDAGMEWVIIVVSNAAILFATRKFGNRLSRFDILPLDEIVIEEEYGFIDSENSDSVSSATGDKVRSVGFTKGLKIPLADYDILLAKLNSLDAMEKAYEEDRKKMNTIKVIAR